eukprot:GHUV01028947.1.p1 GENE.GHUV01028947.1~~GHUV01028947.1.p1  ORF type:complete len:127 (+),score=22.74 GHUV01028947.1:440-820(+)
MHRLHSSWCAVDVLEMLLLLVLLLLHTVTSVDCCSAAGARCYCSTVPICFGGYNGTSVSQHCVTTYQLCGASGRYAMAVGYFICRSSCPCVLNAFAVGGCMLCSLFIFQFVKPNVLCAVDIIAGVG